MNAAAVDPPSIYVIAGVNGAGKSSVVGAHIRLLGSNYYNPDEATRKIQKANSKITLERANEAAWNEGKRLLERAIAERRNFAFETTLGGKTITALLEQACDAGLAVRVWYVGLDNVELHIRRVKERVKRGGHDIPTKKIRQRYLQSPANLISLVPKLSELRVFDNSAESNPEEGVAPQPILLIHVADGEVVYSLKEADVPAWAHPLFRTVSALRPA